MPEINGFHAHVYFDADTADKAQRICEAADASFPLTLGRMHHRLIGPHPRWSCQLAFENAEFSDVISWLMLHRDGLAILIHPLTGDDLADHSTHAAWMGEMLPLHLDMFR